MESLSSAEPAPPSLLQRVLALAQTTSSSRYAQASITYLLYVSIILFINLSLSKRANDVYADDVYYDYDSYSYIMCVAVIFFLPRPP